MLGTFADPPAAGAVIFMSVACTIVAFGAFLTALHFIEPTRATITATLEPVLAGIAAFAVFGERLSLVQLLGGALVLGAIVLVQSRAAVVASLPPPD